MCPRFPVCLPPLTQFILRLPQFYEHAVELDLNNLTPAVVFGMFDKADLLRWPFWKLAHLDFWLRRGTSSKKGPLQCSRLLWSLLWAHDHEGRWPAEEDFDQ